MPGSERLNSLNKEGTRSWLVKYLQIQYLKWKTLCILLSGRQNFNIKATKRKTNRIFKKYSNDNLKPHLVFIFESVFSCFYKNYLTDFLLLPLPSPMLLQLRQHIFSTVIRHRHVVAYIKNIKEDSGKTTPTGSVSDISNHSSPCPPDGDRHHSVWTSWGFGLQIFPSPPDL